MFLYVYFSCWPNCIFTLSPPRGGTSDFIQSSQINANKIYKTKAQPIISDFWCISFLCRKALWSSNNVELLCLNSRIRVVLKYSPWTSDSKISINYETISDHLIKNKLTPGTWTIIYYIIRFSKSIKLPDGCKTKMLRSPIFQTALQWNITGPVMDS